MKWLWRLLLDPLPALDLVDPSGNPDHGKLMGFIAFMVFVAFIAFDKLPPLGHTITMFAGVFGARVFVAFLKSRTVTATEASQVVERRDRDRGVEAS